MRVTSPAPLLSMGGVTKFIVPNSGAGWTGKALLACQTVRRLERAGASKNCHACIDFSKLDQGRRVSKVLVKDRKISPWNVISQFSGNGRHSRRRSICRQTPGQITDFFRRSVVFQRTVNGSREMKSRDVALSLRVTTIAVPSTSRQPIATTSACATAIRSRRT
jgi:hypothetical protein